MLRLALIIVLVAVTASAKHVKKGRPNYDIVENCYTENHPHIKCSVTEAGKYPTYHQLSGISSAEVKRILQRGNTLEKLCSEAGAYFGCLVDAIETASDECKEEYESQQITLEFFQNGVTFLDEVCDEDAIEIIRENLDCLYNSAVQTEIQKCRTPNIDKDCTNLGTAAHDECYEEKYQRNCDVDEVVSCVSEQVDDACAGEDAAQLMELLGNSFFEKFPICPDDKHVKNLLKFFKK